MGRIGTRRSWIALGLTLTLALASATAGRAVGEDDTDKDKVKGISGDLKTLQGTWTSKDDTGEATWTFKGDRLSLKAPGREYEMTIALDEKAKPEKTLDFHVLDTSPNAKGANAPAIYKVDGETVSICMAGPDGARPKAFKNDFPTSLLWELKKSK